MWWKMTFTCRSGKELPPHAKSLERAVRDSGATPFFYKQLTNSDLVTARGVQVSRVRPLPRCGLMHCLREPSSAQHTLNSHTVLTHVISEADSPMACN